MITTSNAFVMWRPECLAQFIRPYGSAQKYFRCPSLCHANALGNVENGFNLRFLKQISARGNGFQSTLIKFPRGLGGGGGYTCPCPFAVNCLALINLNARILICVSRGAGGLSPRPNVRRESRHERQNDDLHSTHAFILLFVSFVCLSYRFLFFLSFVFLFGSLMP